MYYKKYLKYKTKYLQFGGNQETLTIVRFLKSDPKPLDHLKDQEKKVSDIPLPINFKTLFPLYVKWFNSAPIYNNPNFKLINWDNFKKISDDFEKVYTLNNPNEWFNDQIPTVDFQNDPVYAQKVIINGKAKICLIGDLHSSLQSLIEILFKLLRSEYFYDNGMKLKDDRYIIFLGDLVDRGAYGVEILTIVFTLKKLNPINVFIINGNHEDFSMYKGYGLGEEMQNQFNGINFTLTLNYLPSVIYLKFNNMWYHLSHGSFDYKICGYKKMGLQNIDSHVDKISLAYDHNLNVLNRFLQGDKTYWLIENNNYLNPFKWGDFNTMIDGLALYIPKQVGLNARQQFGNGIVRDYLEKNNIKAMITGHQDNIDFAFLSDDKNDKINDETFRTIDSDVYKDNYLGKLNALRNSSDHTMPIKTDIKIIPGKHFLACVTSTAVATKRVMQNTYLVLEN